MVEEGAEAAESSPANSRTIPHSYGFYTYAVGLEDERRVREGGIALLGVSAGLG